MTLSQRGGSSQRVEQGAAKKNGVTTTCDTTCDNTSSTVGIRHGNVQFVLYSLALLIVGMYVGLTYGELSWRGKCSATMKSLTGTISTGVTPMQVLEEAATATTTPPTTSTNTATKIVATKCSANQTALIKQALPSGKAISRNTRCPNSDAWLSDFLESYDEGRTPDESNDPFIFLNLGCNKGYDSLRVAETITRRDDIFNKAQWYKSLGFNREGACRQANEATVIDPSLPKNRPVEVHCVEAMPRTAETLLNASKATHADQHGLHVYNYALVGTSGANSTILFPNNSPGSETNGIGDCKKRGRGKVPNEKHKCSEVKAMTLDEFAVSHVSGTGAPPTATATTTEGTNNRIHYVSIDVEGFDFTVMKGGMETLKRADYLEFEFGGTGDWKTQNLKDATDMLKQEANMNCYWTGKNRLWRITACEDVEVYWSFHEWSNVACVSPEHAPTLALKMEAVFQQTLDKTLAEGLVATK